MSTMTGNKIKVAALKLFSQKGYDGTALSEIAREVGIKTPSIYAHFSSKEELYLAIYRDVVSVEFATVEKVLPDKDTLLEEKLKKIFYYLTDITQEKDEKMFFKRAVFFPPVGMEQILKEEFYQYEQKTTTMLITTLQEGMICGEMIETDPKDIVTTFYCLLDGLLMESHFYNESEYEKRRNSVWNLFWRGIQNS